GEYLRAVDVNDRHQPDVGKRVAQLRIRGPIQAVAELNPADPGATHLGDDGGDVPLRRQEIRRDRRRDSGDDLREELLGGEAGAAGHGRHQAKVGGAGLNRETSLVSAGDASDLDARRDLLVHQAGNGTPYSWERRRSESTTTGWSGIPLARRS